MIDRRLELSVIIPTHNRCSSLGRTLKALADRSSSNGQFEVVVVADGCTDETAKMVSNFGTPFSLRILERPWQGPAAARNAGARIANGRLLLFLDDDVEPASGLIEAHIRAHESLPRGAVVGPCPIVHNGRYDFFNTELRHWWERMFDAMGQPCHRYSFRDLLTGNFSLEKALFEELGMFDTDLRCHEDYEFGVRLIKAGVTLAFAADALAYHHETTDLERAIERKYEEGRADVRMGKRHPELRPVLPLSALRNHESAFSRWLCPLAFRSPSLVRKLMAWSRMPLAFFDRFRIHLYWAKLLYFILACSYWLGVREELETIRALDDFLENRFTRPAEGSSMIEIDLREGLECAERKLDQERPEGVVIRYGHHLVGQILPEPGAEPIRGRHLRPLLATRLARHLAKALALEGMFGLDVAPEILIAAWGLDSVRLEVPTGG